MLSPRIVAQRLGVSRKFIYDLLHAGAFPRARRLTLPGGKRGTWRIPASDVEAYLAPVA